jgi:hypothetical protein
MRQAIETGERYRDPCEDRVVGIADRHASPFA